MTVQRYEDLKRDLTNWKALMPSLHCLEFLDKSAAPRRPSFSVLADDVVVSMLSYLALFDLLCLLPYVSHRMRLLCRDTRLWASFSIPALTTSSLGEGLPALPPSRYLRAAWGNACRAAMAVDRCCSDDSPTDASTIARKEVAAAPFNVACHSDSGRYPRKTQASWLPKAQRGAFWFRVLAEGHYSSTGLASVDLSTTATLHHRDLRRVLSRLPNLTCLDLSHCGLHSDAIGVLCHSDCLRSPLLGGSGTLRTLKLNFCSSLQGDALCTTLEALGTSSRLGHLEVSGCEQLTAQHFARLLSLPTLEKLVCRGTSLCADSPRSLNRTAPLALHASNCAGVTDEFVSFMLDAGAAGWLTECVLSGTAITDAALAAMIDATDVRAAQLSATSDPQDFSAHSSASSWLRAVTASAAASRLRIMCVDGCANVTDTGVARLAAPSLCRLEQLCVDRLRISCGGSLCALLRARRHVLVSCVGCPTLAREVARPEVRAVLSDALAAGRLSDASAAFLGLPSKRATSYPPLHSTAWRQNIPGRHNQKARRLSSVNLY